VERRLGEADLRDDPPHGAHGQRRAERGRRPRAGGHHDGLLVIHPRLLADHQLGSGGARPGGPGAGGGRRRDGAAGGEAVRVDAGRERRLGRLQRGTLEPLGGEAGEARRGGVVVGGQRLRVAGDDHCPGRLGREREPVSEALVLAQRRLVQRLEHRVHRVLQDPRVAPGRARADRLPLVQPHPRPALGQERRRRAAGDAAADHDDVRRHARSAPLMRRPRPPARTATITRR
jgi:hypothetical protein